MSWREVTFNTADDIGISIAGGSAPFASPTEIYTLRMTLRASSRRLLTTSHRGDSGRINSAAASTRAAHLSSMGDTGLSCSMSADA